MASHTNQENPEQPGLNILGVATAKFLQYGQNASHNLQDTFTNLSPQGWLRLIAVVGGYMLLRPYVMKWASKRAVENMEENDEREKAKITANELRGVHEQLEEHDFQEQGDGTSSDWGQKARVRQRTLLKQMLEAEEQRRQEEAEDDEDIKEFLID